MDGAGVVDGAGTDAGVVGGASVHGVSSITVLFSSPVHTCSGPPLHVYRISSFLKHPGDRSPNILFKIPPGICGNCWENARFPSISDASLAVTFPP